MHHERRAARGLLASLVTRLTLAVLAVLLLSLSVTAAVFVVQSYDKARADARSALISERFITSDRVANAVTSARIRANRPLALIRAGLLGVDRILVTRFQDSAVVGDTAYGGGAPPPSVITRFTVNYHGHAYVLGERHIGGNDYEFLASPITDLQGPASASAPIYRDVIVLVRVPTWPQQIATTVGQLWKAGLIAIFIAGLAALLVLRRMTRPIKEMTHASEGMAGGDYDQRVADDGSEDEIGQLARSFNRMAYEVKRAREAQRRFVANVSHDLRSPLTSIIGFSQALTEDQECTPWQRRTAGIINSEAERLQRLTMDLLDLTRLEAGRLPLSRRPLDLNALLREIAARYEALPSRRGVRFSASIGAEALPVYADPDRLTQVAVNLADNALKFCNAGGEVRLSSTREGTDTVIEVYNTGAGIAPEDLPRVFDRFYRGDHSRAEQTGGSGIGLAIVRELVHAHGGTVTATSEHGAWTAMTVRLPLAGEQAQGQEGDGQFTKDLHEANTATTDMYV